MIEGAEQNVATWERLFPDQHRRGLAQAFIDKVATVPNVRRVVAVNVSNYDRAKKKMLFKQMLVTVVEGESLPQDEAMDGVLNVYDKVCDELPSRQDLGHPQIVTEKQYTEDLMILPGYKGQEVTPLWENPSLKVLVNS